MTLREKLIVLRDKAGISQMALAHQLGVSRQAVTRWESGDTTPSMDKLKALAKIYDVSLDWLCNEDESEEKVVGQKEVADRMQVGPGTKEYGALSLAVQYYAKPEIVAIVPPNCFMPRPNVGSAVIRLTRHKEVPVQVNDEKLMFKIIRASFNQRRKTLANGLNNAPDIHLSKEVIQESIEELGVPVTIRGEALTLQQFAQLSNIIGSKIKFDS